MQLTQQIFLAVWGIFLGYWFISAKNVKQTAEVQFDFRKYAGAMVIVVVAIMILGNLGKQYTRSVFAAPLGVQILGDGVAILGLGVAIAARRTLGQNWSARVELKKDHQLITGGVYKYMRHPIYTGVILMDLGAILVFPSSATISSAFILAIILGIKISEEEKLMTKHFPREYPEYKKRVKALIPGVI
jgi:protein-S-isoprenylcysteine O-methyltransferase Ste14